MDNAATLRAQYRNLRDACSWLSAKVFDAKCKRLAHELADGEEVTSAHWVRAAREISDPSESVDNTTDLEMIYG